MSRFCKIVVNLIIIVCIIGALALVIPPLVGISTVVIDTQMDSNMEEGSVAYGLRKPIVTLNSSDQVIYCGDDSAFLYNVKSVDGMKGEVAVVDAVSGAENVLHLEKNATKKVLIIPYIGYAAIALHSNSGILMLGSIAAVLVMLFIVVHVWDSRRRRIDDYDEEEDGSYFSALAQSVKKPSNLDFMEQSPSATETASMAAISAAVKAIEEQQLSITDVPKEEPEGFFIEPAVPTVVVDNGAKDETSSEVSAEEVEDILGDLRGETSDANEQLEDIVIDEDEPVNESVEEPAVDEVVIEETAIDEAITEEPVIDEVVVEGPVISEVITEETDVDETVAEEPVVIETPVVSEKPVEDIVIEDVNKEEAYHVPVQIKKSPLPGDDEELPAYVPPASSLYNTGNIAAALSEIEDEKSAAALELNDSEIPDVSAALVAALASTNVSRSERPYKQMAKPEPEPVEEELDEIELAIPVRTYDELILEAYSNGDDPHVKEDEVTGVKFIDYSDCL